MYCTTTSTSISTSSVVVRYMYCTSSVVVLSTSTCIHSLLLRPFLSPGPHTPIIAAAPPLVKRRQPRPLTRSCRGDYPGAGQLSRSAVHADSNALRGPVMGQIGPKLGQAVFGYSLSTFRGATAITGPYRGISGHASRAHCRGRKISLDEPLDTPHGQWYSQAGPVAQRVRAPAL
jgi:hypothetical protein